MQRRSGGQEVVEGGRYVQAGKRTKEGGGGRRR